MNFCSILDFPPKPEDVKVAGNFYNETVYLFVEWTFKNAVHVYEVEVDWIDTVRSLTIKGTTNENNASLTIKLGSDSLNERFRVRLKAKNTCDETVETMEYPIGTFT